MRGEQRRADRDRPALGEAPRDAERLSLGGVVKAVAGLDFDRGHAFGDQGVEAPQGRAEQVLLARPARRPHGREDAAAAAGDLFVGCAREPHLELARPVAGVDEMGMAVDQPRRDPAAPTIDDAGAGAPGGGHVFLRAGEDDAAVPRGQGAVVDCPEAVGA